MQHSPMACIRKAAIFKNLPNEMLEKLVPFQRIKNIFQKAVLFDNQVMVRTECFLWIKAVPRFTISTKTVKRPY